MRVLTVRVLTVLALSWLLLAGAVLNAAGPFEAGRHYMELAPPAVHYEKDDGRIEVLAFFWYNCGSCYYVDPEVSAWAARLPADVRFVRLPFSYRQPTIFHARLFFALKSLGLDHEADLKVFDLFQKQRQPAHTADQLPRLARSLGLDPQELAAAMESPEVNSQMARLDRLLLAYDLPGVPAMVIDGRYRFDIGTTEGLENYLAVAEELIEARRLERRLE